MSETRNVEREDRCRDAAYREHLIAWGLLRPGTQRGAQDLTPLRYTQGLLVVRLDEAGREVAARRVALGLAGRVDTDRMFSRLAGETGENRG